MESNMKITCRARQGLTACLLSVGVSVAVAQRPVSNNVPPPPPLLLGTSWYPGQWPESRWPADLELMQKAHIHVVRVGDIEWSRIEPSEGQYDLDWLERAIDGAGAHGIYTVLSTPTAAPPQWLTEKYPKTLRTKEDGSRSRVTDWDINFDDAKYRELCHDIASRMAQRFGHNPYVIAWQIDNEINKPSFDAHTREDFQQWLKNQYKTLDNLNASWSTVYWSETYSNWSQIPITTIVDTPLYPYATSGEGTPPNLGLVQSWLSFVSDTWRSYEKNQIDAIREYARPHQLITTNTMGWFDGFDHYVVSQDLDFSAWDDYPAQGHLDVYRNGSTDDLTRGFKRKNFWVIESQPGNAYWGDISNALDKGEVRAMAWHNIGHGADAISYWQWRTALNGLELYNGTLVGADGKPLPLYSEVAQLGAEFEKAGPALAGTSLRSQVAILHTYPSFWAIKWMPMNKGYDPIDELLSYYSPLRNIAQSIDIVQPTAPLAQYKLVVAPGLNVLSDADAKNLIAYVEGGGHLVLGQRSGFMHDNQGLDPQRQPGPLADLLGGRVVQYYALEKPVPVSGQWGNNTSKLWVEFLSVEKPDVQVLESYGASNGWLDSQPAAITRKVGKGQITYIGAWLDEQGMAEAAKWMTSISNVKPAFGPVPKGVEVDPRFGDDHTVFILVNVSQATQTISLPTKMEDVLNGGTVQSVTLPNYGVAVLSEPNQ
jgi:beta-galactosidase